VGANSHPGGNATEEMHNIAKRPNLAVLLHLAENCKKTKKNVPGIFLYVSGNMCL